MTKKENKLKFYKIKDEIYKKSFHLVINESQKDFIDFINQEHDFKKEGQELIELGFSGLFINKFDPYYYIYVEKLKTKEDWAVLHHELNHFVDYVLEDVGIIGNNDNTEVRAYYYEYIYKQIIKAIC